MNICVWFIPAMSWDRHDSWVWMCELVWNWRDKHDKQDSVLNMTGSVTDLLCSEMVVAVWSRRPWYLFTTFLNMKIRLHKFVLIDFPFFLDNFLPVLGQQRCNNAHISLAVRLKKKNARSESIISWPGKAVNENEWMNKWMLLKYTNMLAENKKKGKCKYPGAAISLSRKELRVKAVWNLLTEPHHNPD